MSTTAHTFQSNDIPVTANPLSFAFPQLQQVTSPNGVEPGTLQNMQPYNNLSISTTASSAPATLPRFDNDYGLGVDQSRSLPAKVTKRNSGVKPITKLPSKARADAIQEHKRKLDRYPAVINYWKKKTEIAARSDPVVKAAQKARLEGWGKDEDERRVKWRLETLSGDELTRVIRLQDESHIEAKSPGTKQNTQCGGISQEEEEEEEEYDEDEVEEEEGKGGVRGRGGGRRVNHQ